MAKIMKQMRHCRQCRSDAIGKLGCDVQQEFEKKS
jgi:nitrogen fixation protein NifB